MESKLCLIIACLIVLCCSIEATITLQTLNSSISINQLGRVNKDANTSKIVQEQIGRDVISDIKSQGEPEETNHCYAIVRTNDESSIYYGAVGSMSIYNPSVESPQWSATRMRLQNGDESIEVGVMVNEDLFKDKKTHLYIRYMAGGKGCFNHECPGFIELSKGNIGAVPDKLSKRGEFHASWRLSIDKHYDDGNWWLSSIYNNHKRDIGYWPKNLFTSLADHANQIEWGGEVYYPTSRQAAPEMGCGYKPTDNDDTSLSAFYFLPKVVDEGHTEIDPPESIDKYSNCFLWYSVHDTGYAGPSWGRIFLFGGPKD